MRKRFSIAGAPAPSVGNSLCRSKALLKLMRRAGRFYDGSIEVNGVEIPIHREVLAHLSPFFMNAFCGGFSESAARKLVIRDASSAAVTAIINYAYGENAFPRRQKDFDFALDVMKLAHRFQISGLSEIAASEAVEAAEARDFVKAYHAMQDYGMTDRAGAVFYKMALGFAEMQDSRVICELTENELDALIRSRDLVAEEAQLLQGISVWAKYDVKRREPELDKLLQNIRLEKPSRARRNSAKVFLSHVMHDVVLVA